MQIDSNVALLFKLSISETKYVCRSAGDLSICALNNNMAFGFGSIRWIDGVFKMYLRYSTDKIYRV